MKIRLERVESLLSTSVLEGVDKHPGNPCVPATGEDGLSLLLTDQCGFSSFIGKRYLLD